MVSLDTILSQNPQLENIILEGTELPSEEIKFSNLTQQIVDDEDKFVGQCYYPFSVVPLIGRGAVLVDVEGNFFLDFLGGYGTQNLGHNEPNVAAAVNVLPGVVGLVARSYINPFLRQFCETLVNHCGFAEDGYKAIPMNTGAEAVETGLKAARLWGYTNKESVQPGKAEIIFCENNFHGRTLGIISASTDSSVRNGFAPYTPGIKVIPFNDLSALEKAITPNTVAFVTEPIQGEAGVIIPSDGYLLGAQEICKNNDVQFLIDEVQSAGGRTGKICAYMHEDGVKPDGIMVAKSISAGYYPVSAFVGRAEIVDLLKGRHGSTFGGSVRACLYGMESIKQLEEQKIAQQSAEKGAYLADKMYDQFNDVSYVKEVRGRGMWLALEFTEPIAHEVAEELIHQGILCKDAHDYTLRFVPPIVMTYQQMDCALDRMGNVINNEKMTSIVEQKRAT
jgi:ornithine--oxo-acid transaminase